MIRCLCSKCVCCGLQGVTWESTTLHLNVRLRSIMIRCLCSKCVCCGLQGVSGRVIALYLNVRLRSIMIRWLFSKCVCCGLQGVSKWLWDVFFPHGQRDTGSGAPG